MLAGRSLYKFATESLNVSFSGEICRSGVLLDRVVVVKRPRCPSFRIFSLVFSSVGSQPNLKHLLLSNNDSIQSRLLHSVRVASFSGETPSH